MFFIIIFWVEPIYSAFSEQISNGNPRHNIGLLHFYCSGLDDVMVQFLARSNKLVFLLAKKKRPGSRCCPTNFYSSIFEKCQALVLIEGPSETSDRPSRRTG